MSDLISAALGDNFADKYREAKTKPRIKKLDVTGETRNQIIEEVSKYLKPEEPTLLFRVGGLAYHVILAETLDDLQITPPKVVWGGYRVSLKWQGSWLTGWFKEEDAKNLMPASPYVLVGKLIEKEWKGKPQWSLSVHGFITMQEIIEYKEAKAKQEAEIQEKVEQHKIEGEQI